MNKQKIIIDTDPGIDDAMAVFFAGLSEKLDLVAMTSVFGNVTLDIATRNAMVLAEILNQNIPVSEGFSKPLVQRPNPVSDYVHGKEGFGDIPARLPKAKPTSVPADKYICDLINANIGEIILCPVGPLTNIAMALRHDPTITSKVKSIIIMGGGVFSGGNVTEFAEANIWNDPHAADEVFAADWEVTVIGLDVTQKVVCAHSDFSKLANKALVIGGFLAQATDFYIKFYKEAVGINGCQMHDPITVIATIYPDLFTYEYHPIEVCLEPSRIGETMISKDKTRRFAKVAVDVDIDAVKKIFFDTIETGF
ncbi:nucleoside hydrolase [Amylibacter sp.]|nr:nucleoside hydrolase [Amylibacter sp.]